MNAMAMRYVAHIRDRHSVPSPILPPLLQEELILVLFELELIPASRRERRASLIFFIVVLIILLLMS